MKKKFIMLAMASAFLFVSCSNDDNSVTANANSETENPTDSTPSTGSNSNQQLSAMAKQMLDLINKARTEGCICGDQLMPPVPKLTYNFLLEKAAVGHSEDMAKNKFMDHTGSDGSTPGTRITVAGYKYRAAGENVAAGYRSVEEVMNGWLNSPGHCRNIMSNNYKEVGVAMVNNYWTQVFGTQL